MIQTQSIGQCLRSADQPVNPTVLGTIQSAQTNLQELMSNIIFAIGMVSGGNKGSNEKDPLANVDCMMNAATNVNAMSMEAVRRMQELIAVLGIR